jgi:hypothetical protein
MCPEEAAAADRMPPPTLGLVHGCFAGSSLFGLVNLAHRAVHVGECLSTSDELLYAVSSGPEELRDIKWDRRHIGRFDGRTATLWRAQHERGRNTASTPQN